MPLIEITNAHLLRAPLPYPHSIRRRISCFPPYDDTSNSKSYRRRRFPFLIKAVATAATIVEQPPKFKNNHLEEPLNPHPIMFYHDDDDDERPLDESEKLRRLRISKANKGKTPWNKGRKHSPETLLKIRERTLIAMQNPKVMSCQNEVG